MGLQLLLCLWSICSGITKGGHLSCRTCRFRYPHIDILHHKKKIQDPKGTTDSTDQEIQGGKSCGRKTFQQQHFSKSLNDGVEPKKEGKTTLGYFMMASCTTQRKAGCIGVTQPVLQGHSYLEASGYLRTAQQQPPLLSLSPATFLKQWCFVGCSKVQPLLSRLSQGHLRLRSLISLCW